MHLIVFAFGIVLFIGLVLVHEWGHFFAARRNGVVVEEFGLGFPPRAWSKKLKSDMRLSLNILPLGGFVKLKGEHDSDERKGSFGSASLWAKTKIMLAGVTMNLIAGLLLLTVLALIGMPKLLTQSNVGQDQFTVASDTKIIHQSVLVGGIIKDSPAQKADLKSTDTVVAIQSGAQKFSVKNIEQLHNATTALAGETVKLSYTEGPGNQTVLSKQVKLLSLPEIIADLKNQADLSSADTIKKMVDIDGQFKNPADSVTNVTSDNDIYTAAQFYEGNHIKLTYVHNGQTLAKTVQLSPKAYLGVAPTQVQIQRSTWSAPVVAVGLAKQIFALTFQGLWHALSGLGSLIAGGVTGNHQARINGGQQASSQVGGPVAIGVALWDYGNLGFNFMLFLIALISLTLALMNVLPIPALDGGRLAMMLISRGVFHRPLTRAAEEKIVGFSFALLLGLIVLITVVDVKRFF